MTPLADQAKFLTAWAENTAAAQVNACKTDEALCDWIVHARYRLHDLSVAAPGARAALQVIITKRFHELEPK